MRLLDHTWTTSSPSNVAEDPYGNIVRSHCPLADENPFRFSTKYFDDETGLGYWGQRYYDPVAGRWQSRDPIAEAGGVALYCYAMNSPMRYADPIGNKAEGLLSLSYYMATPLSASAAADGDVFSSTLAATVEVSEDDNIVIKLGLHDDVYSTHEDWNESVMDGIATGTRSLAMEARAGAVLVAHSAECKDGRAVGLSGEKWEKRSPKGDYMRMPKTAWRDGDTDDETLSTSLTTKFGTARCGAVRLWLAASPSTYNTKIGGPIRIVWRRGEQEPDITITESSGLTAGLAWAIGEAGNRPATYTADTFKWLLGKSEKKAQNFLDSTAAFWKTTDETSPDDIQKAWDEYAWDD